MRFAFVYHQIKAKMNTARGSGRLRPEAENLDFPEDFLWRFNICMHILQQILESRRCVLQAYTIKSEQQKNSPPDPPDPPDLPEMGHIRQVGPRVLAPGARMMVVTQTPSNKGPMAARDRYIKGPWAKSRGPH